MDKKKLLENYLQARDTFRTEESIYSVENGAEIVSDCGYCIDFNYKNMLLTFIKDDGYIADGFEFYARSYGIESDDEKYTTYGELTYED